MRTGKSGTSAVAAASVLYASHHRCLGAVGVGPNVYFTEVRWQVGRFLGRLKRAAIPVATAGEASVEAGRQARG